MNESTPSFPNLVAQLQLAPRMRSFWKKTLPWNIWITWIGEPKPHHTNLLAQKFKPAAAYDKEDALDLSCDLHGLADDKQEVVLAGLSTPATAVVSYVDDTSYLALFHHAGQKLEVF